ATGWSPAAGDAGPAGGRNKHQLPEAERSENLRAGTAVGSDGDGGRPAVLDDPTHRRRHASDVLGAEIEEVRVALVEEVIHDDHPLRVDEGDGRDRLMGAPHLRADTHRGQLKITRV